MCDANKGVCDKVNGVNCECDADCSVNTCMCNVTAGVCDKVNGVNCNCDVDCAMSSCQCDVMLNVCDKDQAGNNCVCDPLCPKP
jgi:hypothetical protein